MPIERDYPIYLQCATCQRCTEHHMIFEGTAYTDLICQACKQSSACPPKAAGGGK